MININLKTYGQYVSEITDEVTYENALREAEEAVRRLQTDAKRKLNQGDTGAYLITNELAKKARGIAIRMRSSKRMILQALTSKQRRGFRP